MRNLNFLRKSERKSVGTTLALTVGSPSAHRRYSALKHLTFMLLFLLGSLNVWGYTITFSTGSGDGTSASTSTACSAIVSEGASYLSGNLVTATKVYYSGSNGLKLGASSNAGTIKMNLASSVTPTSIVVRAKLYNSSKATTLKVNGSATQNITADFSNLTFDITSSTSYIQLESSKYCWIESITVNTGSTTPTVTADPEEMTDVVAAGVTNQTIDLTYENITDYVTEVSVRPNADGTGTLDPAWLTASVSDADDYATVTYSVSANEGAARTAYIKVYTTDGDAEATTIIPISQVKYSAPTGTFELFSGDLAEGDYVICSGTTALKNTEVSGPRIGYETISISENKIQNPDESLVWKIEALTGDDAGKWTIYNETEDVYAAFNTTDGRGVLLDEVTNYAKWTTSGTYDFINVGKTSKNYLRYNNGFGFASYASGTGATLTLYKKQVAGQPATPEFSVAEGNYEEAQSVEISCETVGATIHYTLDGTKPTSSSPTYSTALNISSTTTVKAVAIKDDVESTVATATYTIVVWQTVDEIWSSITSEGPTNANVWGYVSQANVGGYNNNYYISVDGSLTANQLEIYKGDNAGNTVAVGDKVHVNGDLTIFNEIKEFKQNTGVIVHYAAKGALQSVAVSGTPTKTEYASGEDFEPAGLKVFGTYANGFVGEITEGITWGNDLTDGKVTENTTVHVTATVSGITNSPAHNVGVTVAAKTLLSIAVGTASYTIYTGEVLPKPVVTATFSEGDPEDVSAYAVYDSESVFNTATIDDPDPQTITVSYTFGGETKTTTYTVSVQDYENADNAPYSVTEALHIITAAIGNTESAREIVVTGTVSEENISNNKNRYKISDSTNELLVYAGKGFNKDNFTNDNYPKVGDVVKVKGKVINYNNNTPEFASGKSYLLSQIRPATLAIEDVASLEVGADDLAEGDLDITTPSDGDITFVSGDDTKATIIANAIHAVAPGTVTITANLAATENDDALNYAAASTTFSVTVVAPATKYAITFDGNGNTGGSAPEAIENKAAGAEVTLPANSYTKTGHTFTGWKVYDENEDEVTVTANTFEMPASPVTIKAQWAEIPVWAYTYTSNVTLTGAKVKFYGEETEYDAVKAGTGSAAGSTSITVPAQATKLHFHAYGWNTENVGLTVTAPTGVTVSPATEISINKNAGIKENSPFTLAEGSTPMTDAYYVVELSGNDDEIELTFTATSGKRFVLFGVNQEGGVLPVLESIEISGDLGTKTGYKVGDALDLDGLTVEATYSLGGVAQSPVDITSDPELELTYDPLVEDQTEVTITASYKGQTDDITITGLDPVASADPKIYVSTLNVNFASVEVGESVPAAETVTVTLTNVASVTATLGGTNADAFSVSPASLTESGDITISILANTDAAASYAATLTISDGEGGADDKTVNLSFAVTEPVVEDDVTGTWTLVTNATTLAAGKKVIIAQYVEADGAINTMAGQASNNRSVIASTVAGATLTPAVGTKVMTLADAGEGNFYLKTSDGEYLYNASTSSKSYLRTKAEEENVSWTIAVDAEGVATITSVENTNRTKMRYNPNTSGSPLFNCYASGQEDIALYMLEEDTPEPPVVDYTEVRNDLTEGWYYTMCLDKAVTAVKAGSIWRVLSKAANGNDVILEEVTGTLAAGRPYIFRAAASTLEVAYTGDAVGAPVNDEDNNGLIGSFTQELITESATNFIIYENALYFVNSEAYVGAHRAYLNMTGVPAYSNEPQQGNAPRRRVTMSVHGEQTATGIDALNAAEAPVKVLINGQMYILRGEKMYNVNGQVVK